ncbi:UDP-N-acetylmuramoyl-tripeptide--D-alanyl-D-alanine ligase [Pelagicoccus sp. SDUM812005]|uniref:UDP-N-acetylmuramoyl-tripeptide--D-alanyl-D- alanine ligase n=1 Tax=Pelagicoccus sp. SDUM812005 TaxID=3041257 RepID=UPI00280E5FA7|nr:UDP-N-acetylmuramoyl-tripeptide--D-alanyl-D-alanine ligase [Pelagicoccus sp. SDUM812005]MDQ8180584.1 UDP-N-acetylmuramoyl-tripeptide--D-alanyl-D-alanine ligase [Pelagicoccus sp. SDUM812005]
MASIDPVALANWTSGTWKNRAPSTVSAFNYDSRKLEAGQVFVALRTASRDGHDFLAAAKEAGASGALVDRFQPEVDLPQLVVADVSKALIEAARGYRLSWKAQVVGITGSCGKTTCKEVLACLLSERGTLSTVGNLNNLIGVPVSILRSEGQAVEFAVLEAGISEPGEMEQLARAICPDWGIVTAIGPAHLQDLGTVETVAIEKGKLLQEKGLRGAFVGETAEPYLSELDCRFAKVVRRDASLAGDWSFDFASAGGRTKFRQRIAGEVRDFEYAGSGAGLASNVALAVATAVSLGVDLVSISRALGQWASAQMRNEWREQGANRVFLDCYNANPISMRDSLRTFAAETPEEKPRFYLLGCMEELGGESPRLHEELAGDIPLRKRDFLLVIGSEAKSVLRGMKDAGCDTGNCFEIASVEEAKDRLARFAGSVFLKGSRRYRLESALDYLKGGVSC